MKKVLIKDIVIPAGTVFIEAPTETKRSTDFGEALVGLTNDTCGSFVYPILGDDEEKLKEWFVDLK